MRSVSELMGHEVFRGFLAARRADPACHGLDLLSFAIQPVQRITRYELLLKAFFCAHAAHAAPRVVLAAPPRA